MKRKNIKWLAAMSAAVLLTTGVLTATAADASKIYQVTGPVLEVTPTTVTVKKGEETWQIARPAGTKVTGDLKVGAKATIYYTMTASEIEVKGTKEKKQ